MKNYTYALLTVFLGLSLTTCKNDQVTPDPTTCNCQYVKEAKDYFAFKVGSWWVYEEENTLERDSVYVTQSTISDEPGYNFDVQIYSDKQGYYYHYYPTYINSTNCSQTKPVNTKCLYVNRAKQKPGDFVGSDYCLFFAHKKLDFIYISNVAYPNDKLQINDIFDHYQLDTYDFQHTIKVHELNTYIEGKQPTNHYFSKDIGLVRKELIDSNQVWNLVNYHIEP